MISLKRSLYLLQSLNEEDGKKIARARNAIFIDISCNMLPRFREDLNVISLNSRPGLSFCSLLLSKTKKKNFQLYRR